MTSEDWKTVLLAAITTFGGIGTAFILGYLEILRRKANVATSVAADAKNVAVGAAAEMKKTQGLINGRMDQILADKEKEKAAAVAKAFADGRQAGMALTMQAVAQSDKIPLAAQGVAEVVAKVSSHD